MTTLESTSERLEEALRRLAVEASDLFEELLAGGAEMPFEVEPSDDGPLPMYSYVPQTADFISRHQAELRRLDAFVEVRELSSEEAAIGFMAGLWHGKTDFEIVTDALEGAVDAVLATAGPRPADSTAAGEVLVPLIGFHMPADEIELDGVRVVRADTVDDAPLDAVETVRGPKGRSGFLAQVSCDAAGVAPAAAVADDLRRALRTMRLFRPGAVGLGAHGWARRPGGWERFDTGVGRTPHGGYRLTGNEAADLENFARTLAERGARLPSLDWAAARFDLGAERTSLIEALSDYLLALRGLLEGGGPANLGLSARVAALACEDSSEREAARLCVERALAIERKLMSGARFRPAQGTSPLDVIAELEELLRRILNRLATGEAGADLRAQADEVLLAQGLQAADAAQPAMGHTAEWRLPEPTGEDAEEDDLMGEIAGLSQGEVKLTRADAGDDTARIVVDDVELPDIMGTDPQPEQGEREQATQAVEPVEARRTEVFTPEPDPEADWFSAGEGGDLEWPAFASPRREQVGSKERRQATDRVRYLFPVPDSTDWDVGELRYKSN